MPLSWNPFSNQERGTPDYIYLALGGDGLHIDNQNKTTTRGTLQDCDGTPEELAWTWVEMCREYVDLVRQFAPVKLFVVAESRLLHRNSFESSDERLVSHNR